jgi:hypothetical protein
MKTKPNILITLLSLSIVLLTWAHTAAAAARNIVIDSLTITVSLLNAPPLTSADTILVRNGGTLYVDANATIGTLTVGDYSGAGSVVFNSVTAQTLTVAGDLAFGPNPANFLDMSLSTAHTMQVAGDFLASGAGTFRAGAATIEYNNTTVQSVTANIGGTGATIQYRNLILSGNPATGMATKNLANGVSVQGTLTITQKAVPSGGSVTYGPLSALVYSGSAAQNTTPSEWSAAPAVLNVPVIINNVSGVTLDSDKTIGAVYPSSLTLQTGTLYDNGKTLSVQGNITNATALQGTGVLVLNGSSAQTLTGLGNYGNLTLNNAAGASLPTANATTPPTINGWLIIASGKLKLPNGTTHQTSLLTFGDVNKPAGTYGSSISAAAYKSDTAFNNAATGILTVNNTGCLPPNITSVVLQAGVLTLSFQSQPEFTYDIQFKDSLTDPVWNGLRSVVASAPATTVTDSPQTHNRRFYRVACRGGSSQ